MPISPPLSLSPSARQDPPARIHRSWERCAQLDPAQLADPNPLPRADLVVRREANQRLLRHAGPGIGALGAMAGAARGLVLLTDPSGLILHEEGCKSFLDKARRVALQPGVSWAEPMRGTNAIGTALHDGKPVRVHGREHFLPCNSILSCHAAPIFSATGEILGILDLSGPADEVQDYALGLVWTYARQIADRVLCDTPLARLEFTLEAAPRSAAGHAILLLDDDKRIAGANEAALTALGADWDLIGSPIGRWLDGPLDTHEGLLRRRDGGRMTGRLHAPAPAPVRGRGAAQALAAPPAARALPAPDALSRPLLEQAVRAVDAGLAVLLQGETGTGKEVLARHVHAGSSWRQGSFVAINCAALPESLVESELFGYESGAFTGARRDGARGLLLQAQHGIVFLDEIGDMPLALQTRLLRVLQEREVQPLGSDKRIPLEFGLISASHQDLKALVARGAFRADLYYRLQDMPVHLPPLRNRPGLPEFLDRYYADLGGRLEPEALEFLAALPWPGNYREMRSLLNRLRCLYPGPSPVGAHMLPKDLLDPSPFPTGGQEDARAPDDAHNHTEAASTGHNETRAAPRTLREIEDRAIEQALQACQGNISRAARLLGMHRSTLHRRLQQ
ncbi:sigma-54-dependent Fis family transcriptional regulator [Castellaniella sp. GW247-6E4]|uniref:sigma-54-dependent Fis family transcriptional regulator n=1 Tax=Castellaniella sp. GW247-6E4 TaxID=3140380 RepID=UPI00331612B2